MRSQVLVARFLHVCLPLRKPIFGRNKTLWCKQQKLQEISEFIAFFRRSIDIIYHTLGQKPVLKRIIIVVFALGDQIDDGLEC